MGLEWRTVAELNVKLTLRWVGKPSDPISPKEATFDGRQTYPLHSVSAQPQFVIATRTRIGVDAEH